jgi:hypothetical protein
MEESVYICPSCGKQNPANARFCYACGATLSAGVTPTETDRSASLQDAGAPFSDQETQIPAASYSKPQPQYVPPAPTPEAYFPPKPRKRGRVRCCAVGCLVVLLVLLIGLPILHITVLRPLIEGAIYKQVSNSLEDVASSKNNYYGTDTESITERQLNDDAKSAWDYLPGSTDGHIYLQQDQIRLEAKFYGVKVWAAADMRVNNRGEFVVKSMKMHWLLNVLFSESALKREIAQTINEKIVRPKGLFMLAFQVSEGKLFVAYEPR